MIYRVFNNIVHAMQKGVNSFMNAKSAVDSKSKRKTEMLEENIRTLIPRMAFPTIVAQLITVVYNLADTFFVSTLGTAATAAVGVNSSLERTITLIGSLIGSGACSYIARLLGAKDDEKAHRVMSTSFFTGLFMGIILMIFGLFSIDKLVFWLGATDECAHYAVQYARYVLLAAPVMIGSFILNMCLKSEGSATLAMVGIGLGGILNCFLDPIFIFTFDLGVAGASIATAISKFISFCVLSYVYVTKKSIVQISIKRFQYTLKDVKEVLSIGSTSFFRSGLMVVCNILINRVAGNYSTAALAALSVSNRIMEFPFSIILGFGMGYQPVAGFNWGAKQIKRVRESLKFAVKVSMAGCVVMGTLLFIFAGSVIHIFNSQADMEVLELGKLCIRLQCFALPAHSFISLYNMFFSGIGKAKCAIVLSTGRQGYCMIPMIILLPIIFGVKGLASAQAAADFLALVPAVWLSIYASRLLNEAEAKLVPKQI